MAKIDYKFRKKSLCFIFCPRILSLVAKFRVLATRVTNQCNSGQEISPEIAWVVQTYPENGKIDFAICFYTLYQT